MNHSQQIQDAVTYYAASTCSGIACVALWLAENKDAITALSALVGATCTIVFGCIGVYIQLRRKW